MANLLLQNGAWQLAKVYKQLGLIGSLGSALVLANTLIYLSGVLALNQQISDAKNMLAQASSTQDINFNNVKPLLVKNPADEIEAFKQSLPKVASLHEWLSAINQAAIKQKLVLNRGDYQYSKTKQSQISEGFYLSKYEIVLPVAGQYVQVRQFIAQALQLQPALALSEIKMIRENAQSPTIEARLIFDLYLQSEIK